MALEVIIPVKDRAEVRQCVQSLLEIAAVQRIWLCDGGSQQPDCLTAVATVATTERVQWVKFPTTQFNKSHLLNQGILLTSSQFLLISDADIIWTNDTIQALLKIVAETDDLICSVSEVKEVNADTIALRRQRYTYQIQTELDPMKVTIISTEAMSSVIRPGCGLICARRTTLLKLGGYKECFQGWGWEDQDLLMRARLLGVPIQVAGEVTHLSHGDAQRNQSFPHLQPIESRDRNILLCLQQLAEGYFWGDLPTRQAFSPCQPSIQIQIPPMLQG